MFETRSKMPAPSGAAMSGQNVMQCVSDLPQIFATVDLANPLPQTSYPCQRIWIFNGLERRRRQRRMQLLDGISVDASLGTGTFAVLLHLQLLLLRLNLVEDKPVVPLHERDHVAGSACVATGNCEVLRAVPPGDGRHNSLAEECLDKVCAETLTYKTRPQQS